MFAIRQSTWVLFWINKKNTPDYVRGIENTGYLPSDEYEMWVQQRYIQVYYPRYLIKRVDPYLEAIVANKWNKHVGYVEMRISSSPEHPVITSTKIAESKRKAFKADIISSLLHFPYIAPVEIPLQLTHTTSFHVQDMFNCK